MRWFPLLACLGCASAPTHEVSTPPPTKPVQEPFWSTRSAEPLEAPLVALATERTYFILATEEFGPECRAWSVKQSKQRDDDLAYLVAGDDSIGFVNHGAQLELRSRTRATHHSSESTACSGSFSVSERDDGLDVSGARWFTTEADCDSALASKDRLAFDLSTCAWRPHANLQQQAASQRKFEAMLRFGGSAFSIVDDACKPLHATANRGNTRESFTGELWSELRDGTKRGKSGFGYQLQAHSMELVLLGPHSEWPDGGGYGLLCGHEQVLEYGNDSVEVDDTLYLSAASCRSALARERTRKARLPKTDDDESVAMQTPSLGGC